MRLGSRYERAVRKLERLAELWNFALLSAVAAGFLTGILSEFFVLYPVRRWLQALFLVLVAVPVWAGDRGMCVRGYQQVGESTFHMSVTRIADFEDGHSAWLTAGHCVERGKVVLVDGAGRSHEAEVVADSKNPDLALIKGPAFIEKRHFRLVDRSPRQASVYSFVAERRKAYDIAVEDSGELFGNVKAEQGESGAPAYERDECYGLLIGNTQDVKECSLDYYGRQVCRVRQGRVTFERSRTIIRWLKTTPYQPCEPNVAPVVPMAEPQPQPVGRADCDCESQFALLRRRIEQLESIRPVAGPPGPAGPRGHDGAQGPAGKPGQVTVILEDGGKQIFKQPEVQAGSVVRVPIRRTEKTDAK